MVLSKEDHIHLTGLLSEDEIITKVSEAYKRETECVSLFSFSVSSN